MRKTLLSSRIRYGVSGWPWLLAGLFAFALALRCYGLFAPLLDAHSWRQADTAAIARNFVASGMRFSHPQVDWGGATAGYVESEFPLYTGALAVLFRAFGSHDWPGRLLTALFGAAAPLAIYSLVREQNPISVFQRRAALYAALALCVMPFPLYFGRTVMPDTLMLLTATLAIWTFQRWATSQERQMWAFVLALVCGALAPLAKTPNLVIVAVPLAYLTFTHRLWRRWPQLLLYAACFVLPVLLWTRHAATLPEDPRLSFGIGEKLLDTRLLIDPQFYLLVGRWAAENVLTWAGAVLCVVGCAALMQAAPQQGRYLALVWLAGVVAFLLLGAAGVVGQDYYLLPLAGPGAWLIGLGIAQAQAWVAPRWRRVGVGVPVAALLLIAALSLVRIAPMYAVADFYGQLGQRVDLALPAGQRVGVVAPAVSEILYYGNRKGWRLDPGVLVPGGLASLGPDLGVRYVLIADPWLSERRDLLAAELQTFRRVPVGPYALLLDLQQPGFQTDFELVWETGHVIEGAFLAKWRALGGVDTMGFPISDALPAAAGNTQYFERVVLRETGDDVVVASAGRELLELRGQAPQLAPVTGAFDQAWDAAGGEAMLGAAITPVVDGVQFFENGALEQQADGSIHPGAVGRWLLDARGLSEEAQISMSTTR